MTVKEMRSKVGMTQTQFADHLHIKIDTLRMWEQGVNNPPQHTVYMIHRILELEGMIERK